MTLVTALDRGGSTNYPITAPLTMSTTAGCRRSTGVSGSARTERAHTLWLVDRVSRTTNRRRSDGVSTVVPVLRSGPAARRPILRRLRRPGQRRRRLCRVQAGDGDVRRRGGVD